MRDEYPFSKERERIYRATSRCRNDADYSGNMLGRAIDLIVEHVKMYTGVYSNESNVEDQLIPLVLHALGWEPGNPQQVQTKIGIKGNSKIRPDFVLFNNGEYFAFIEAKRLGNIKIKDHKEKIEEYLKYSENVILTDGMRWIGFTGNSLKPLWTFYLSQTPHQYCIDLLLTIHPTVQSMEESVDLARMKAESFTERLIGDRVNEILEEVDLRDILVEHLVEKISPKLKRFYIGLFRHSVHEHLSNLWNDEIDEKMLDWAQDLLKESEEE